LSPVQSLLPKISFGKKNPAVGRIRRVKCWQAIAEKLSKAGFSWGCSSQINSTGRVLFTADAYSSDGRRFIVLSDDKLSAFLELEAAIRACGEFS